MTRTEAPEEEGPAGPLRGECGHCDWRRLFNSDSDIAELPLAIA